MSEEDVVGMAVTQPVIELVNTKDPCIAVWARIRFDLDLATETGARTSLRAICATAVQDRMVVVEFGPGRFVAVCGLQVLLDVADLVRGRGGQLAVVRPPPSLRRMHTIFQVGPALPLLDGPLPPPITHRRRNGIALPECATP
jgi:anti-anti-sigma regulatory factor